MVNNKFQLDFVEGGQLTPLPDVSLRYSGNQMAKTLEEIRAELEELMRRVREHGARLQRDLDSLRKRADEKESDEEPPAPNP